MPEPSMGCGASKDVAAVGAHRVVPASNAEQARNICHAAVQKAFPGAIRNDDLMISIGRLTQRLGLSNDNTLFAHSTCPDEINQEEGDITLLLRDEFGEMFIMGGLAGIPFVGKTGFAAFSHHITDDGNLFILFAPHVAVLESGKVGYYNRVGQHTASTACGAAMGAWAAVKDLESEPVVDAASPDYQMDFIKRGVWRQRARIAAKPQPEVELAFVVFELVRDMMLSIVNTEGLTHGKIVLLGGLQINATPEDYFLPLHCSVQTKADPSPKDALAQLLHL